MSGYRLAAPHGAWIDRSKPLQFQFNDRPVQGFDGDTVASALLAQGIVQVGRSFKLHRPRGIFSCGVEESSGLLDIGLGGARTPNTRATDIAAREGLQAFTGNAWPSLTFDLGAVASRFAPLLPAGFYYKTFMWPHWHLFEPTIRRLAGLGVAADAPDPDRYDQVSRQVQVLVVGAGAAGVQAALSAAQSGHQVLLLEGAAQLEPAAAARLPALHAAGVEVHTGCSVFGLYDHLLAAALQTVEADVRERLWKIRADRIILATGAFERPMLFPDNDAARRLRRRLAASAACPPTTAAPTPHWPRWAARPAWSSSTCKTTSLWPMWLWRRAKTTAPWSTSSATRRWAWPPTRARPATSTRWS